MNTRKLFVGLDGKDAVNSERTQAQIDEVKKLTCALVTPLDKPMLWEDLDDPNKPKTIIQASLIFLIVLKIYKLQRTSNCGYGCIEACSQENSDASKEMTIRLVEAKMVAIRLCCCYLNFEQEQNRDCSAFSTSG